MAQSSTNTRCKQNEEKETTHGLILWSAFVAGDDRATAVAGGSEEDVDEVPLS